MELSNLLTAMVQSTETDALAQIRAGSSGGANAGAQGGLGANGQAVTGQTALTLASQPPGLNVTGQTVANGQPISRLRVRREGKRVSASPGKRAPGPGALDSLGSAGAHSAPANRVSASLGRRALEAAPAKRVTA